MLNKFWQQAELASETATPMWELFHEASKTGHYDGGFTNEQVVEEMNNLYEVFPYKQFELIPLPETFAPIGKSFLDSVLERKTPSTINPVNLSLETLRTILHCGYGITRDNKDSEYINRSFRTVPSGGALYPLEIYFYTNNRIEGLGQGIYHYVPTENAVQLIRDGNFDQEISESLVSFQPHLAFDCSLLLFITAAFNRSIFKYKDKGYRFTLLEAGHVAQNINLAATSLDLGVINIGGFHDRMVDRFLKLDGLNHSTIYMNGICERS